MEIVNNGFISKIWIFGLLVTVSTPGIAGDSFPNQFRISGQELRWVDASPPAVGCGQPSQCFGYINIEIQAPGESRTANIEAYCGCSTGGGISAVGYRLDSNERLENVPIEVLPSGIRLRPLRGTVRKVAVDENDEIALPEFLKTLDVIDVQFKGKGVKKYEMKDAEGRVLYYKK